VASATKKIPIGNYKMQALIRSSAELGVIVRERRKELDLTQIDLAGVGGTGNRFIVDLESGKPTLQLQKTLDVMALLGLEVIIRAKGGANS
jgi:HTH-type transcriptional regulator/antitoxin HipB